MTMEFGEKLQELRLPAKTRSDDVMTSSYLK